MADDDKNGNGDDKPKRGELKSNLSHQGRLYEAGTKVSEVPDLSAEQKDRLKQLGVI